ncbi:MAG TPA: RidA family protein [Alphaproteobacteria bacterium]|nr:RidA family protein [Alphaproteobacteria bacterium]
MSRFQHVDPPTVPASFSRYSQGVAVPSPARWLHVSGQVGIPLGGVLPDTFEEQARNAWRNVLGVLEAAGMAPADLVKVTAYITRPSDVGQYRTVRDSMIGGLKTASTLVVVAGLADPLWLIEIEAIAAA